RIWSGGVATWDQHGSAALTRVTAAVLEAADVAAGAQVVDLGCGTGQISLPLALRGAEVLAVDVSSAMVRRLRSEARRRSASGLEGLALPIEDPVWPPATVDPWGPAMPLTSRLTWAKPGLSRPPYAGRGPAG